MPSPDDPQPASHGVWHAGAPARPFRPIPTPSVRPWAGTRLGLHGLSVGELWLAGPASRVPGAVDGEATLDELAARHGAALVGGRGMALLGPRFPLLVKLIDAADRLSLQVHPDDALARELYGPDALGKAEAWLILDAAPGATLVTGPGAGLDAETVRDVVVRGVMDLEHCATSEARAGDTLLLRPGTIHAIGAGTFVYEIEQPSDLTFRISDWGRPTGRTLHLAEALRAVDPVAHAVPVGRGWALDDGRLEVPEFRLELVAGSKVAASDRWARTPAGRTVEVVTALRGTVVARGEGWEERLAPWETLVVPAAIDAYELAPGPDALVAVGSIP